jgi:hypothetical protein
MDLRLAMYFSWIPGKRVHFKFTVLDVYGRTMDGQEKAWRMWLTAGVRRAQETAKKKLMCSVST